MARNRYRTLSLPFELTANSETPLFKQLSNGLIEMIQTGDLKPGDFLPGTKALSSQLNIARDTVVKAFETLTSLHYLETVIGVGTRVSLSVSLVNKPDNVNRLLINKLSQYAKRIEKKDQSPINISGIKEANYGGPPLDLLPEKAWKQCLAKHAKSISLCSLHSNFNDPLGNPKLREVLSNYLNRARITKCDSDHIAIFPGSLHALNLVAELFTNPGDVIAVENPGYPYAREVFQTHGAKLEPISIDDNGIVVSELENSNNDIKLVYVTPSHHDPTGATMSISRRKQLLDWAKRTDTIIIEDDFDNEYRSEGSMLPSLHGIDDSDRVFYIGSFWKSLYPLSFLGYMIIPKGIVEVVSRAELLRVGVFSALEMHALADFIETGQLEKHIRKTAAIYKSRNQNMLRILKANFGDDVKINKFSAGHHSIIEFTTTLSDEEVTEVAGQCGLPLISTKFYYAENQKNNEFVIVFAHLTEEEMTESIVEFSKRIQFG